MPTLERITRARRKRQRAPTEFEPHEIEWLTGEPQPGANPFGYFGKPPEFWRALAARAAEAGLITPDRQRELERALAAGRHPSSCAAR